MAKGQILKNHTLKEYQEKYGNNVKLVKFNKKEVGDFNKKVENSNLSPNVEKEYENFLLADRTWWLIGDTYYEIPADGKIIPNKEVKVSNVKEPKVSHFRKPNISMPKFNKPNINFDWVKNINKKVAIIAVCATVGGIGVLAGGHYLTSYLINREKPILSVLGGKEINFTEAKNLANNYDLNVADAVNFDAKLRSFSIQNATLEAIEAGAVTYSFPLNINWSGVNYKNSITYKDILLLQGETEDTGTDSESGNVSEDTAEPEVVQMKNYLASSNAGLPIIGGIKMNSSLSSISSIMFHQVYDYILDNFNDVITLYTDVNEFTLKYFDDNGALGIYINISDLSKFMKSTASYDDFNFSGVGSLECGLKIGKTGFVDRFMLKVSGKDVSYSNYINRKKAYFKGSRTAFGSDTTTSYLRVKGDFNLNIDLAMNRTLAEFIPVNYTVNNLSLEDYKKQGGELEAPSVYIIDPLYHYDETTGEIQGILEKDQSVAVSGRTYRAYFTGRTDGKESTETFNETKSSICIDGINYLMSSDPMAKYVKFGDASIKIGDAVQKAKYVEIDACLINKNHTYDINIVTDKSK